MASWLVPFGFAAGYTFSLITGLDTFAWAGTIGNRVIGGLLGAISGAMGSFLSVAEWPYPWGVGMTYPIAIAWMRGSIWWWLKVPAKSKAKLLISCGN